MMKLKDILNIIPDKLLMFLAKESQLSVLAKLSRPEFYDIPK